MDYEQYALAHYNIETDAIGQDAIIFFYVGGSFDIVLDSNIDIDNYDDLESFLGVTTNYYNRELAQRDGANNTLVSFAYCFTNRNLLFFNTNRLDYGVYGSSNSTGYLQGLILDDNDTGFDDLTLINNYYNVNGSNPFSDYNDEGVMYGTYNVNLTNQNGYAVFDYYNIKYTEGESPYINIRGENTSYYTTMTGLILTSTPNYIYFSYGAPYYSIGQSEYTRGESAGYGAGWIAGNDNGYQIGINQNGNIGQESANAFNFIGQGFSAISSIMALEILPNITLGVAFTIPMVFVLIMTIFKLVRK